jgi:ferritin-like metal-binding protein YciE
MAIFSSLELTNLQDLFVEQLQDLYDAENRLVDALPKMVDAAVDKQLKAAFKDHLKETKQHVSRLETVFQQLGLDAKRDSCEAMKGLIKEGEKMVDAKGDSAVKDAALIAAAQRVEHYEMAGYGTARSFAEQLGHHQAAQILQQTLDEEGNANKTLSKVAESWVNVHASQA